MQSSIFPACTEDCNFSTTVTRLLFNTSVQKIEHVSISSLTVSASFKTHGEYEGKGIC